MDNRDRANRVAALLEEEKETFLQVCELTDLMVCAEADEIAELSERRGEALQRAAEIRKSALAACGDDPGLVDALNLRGDARGDGECARRVRDLSLGVHALWNRAMLNNAAVAERIDFLKRDVTERIETLNRGSARFAGRYSDSVRTGLGEAARGADKGRFI